MTAASFEDCIRSIAALWLNDPEGDEGQWVWEYCAEFEFADYSKYSKK